MKRTCSLLVTIALLVTLCSVASASKGVEAKGTSDFDNWITTVKAAEIVDMHQLLERAENNVIDENIRPGLLDTLQPKISITLNDQEYLAENGVDQTVQTQNVTATENFATVDICQTVQLLERKISGAQAMESYAITLLVSYIRVGDVSGSNSGSGMNVFLTIRVSVLVDDLYDIPLQFSAASATVRYNAASPSYSANSMSAECRVVDAANTPYLNAPTYSYPEQNRDYNIASPNTSWIALNGWSYCAGAARLYNAYGDLYVQAMFN